LRVARQPAGQIRVRLAIDANCLSFS
jgi:hypothetical protein